MIRPVRFLLMLVCLLSVSQALAADVAYVDMERLLEQSPQAEQASERLRKMFKDREAQLAGMKARITRLQEDNAVQASSVLAEDNSEAAMEIRRMEREYRRAEQEFREDLAFRKNEEYQRVREKIVAAVSEYARNADIHMVLVDGVVYANPGSDITDEILRTLSQALADEAEP